MAAVKEFSIEEKLSALVLLQKVDCKLDEIQILKGELPIEVKDLEDEIEGLHARQTRVEEEINGMQEFINQKREAIKEAEALDKKYEKKSENVKVMIVPGSQQVAAQIVAEGLDVIFNEAGFQIRQAGCSACLGMNEDKIPAGEYCISTSNRNFEGRQGAGARTLLGRAFGPEDIMSAL